jgi:hypothetical protein
MEVSDGKDCKEIANWNWIKQTGRGEVWKCPNSGGSSLFELKCNL